MSAAPAPQDFPEEASEQQRTGWAASLGPASGVAFIVCVAIVLYFRGQAVDLHGAFSLVWLAVPVPGIALWGLVLSWVAFHLSGRKQSVSAAVFMVACGLFTMGSVAQAVNHTRTVNFVTELATVHADQVQAFEYDVAETDRLLAELEGQQSPTRPVTPGAAQGSQTIRRAFAPGPDAAAQNQAQSGSDHLARFRRGIEGLKRAGRVAPAREARYMQAMIEVIEPLDPLVSDYTEALERFTDAGGVDPLTLPNARTIDARLAKLADIEAAGARQRRAYEGLEGKLRTRFEALGESSAVTAELMHEWRQGINLELVLAFQDTDQRLIEAMRGMLETLRDGMGHWRVDPGRGLEFDTDGLLNQYNAHHEKLLQAGQEQLKIQRQLLQKQKSLW